jgi:epothilone synthetase B
MKAIQPMYGEYSLRYATLEAGLMTQVLEMSAPARHIGLCQLGGLDFARTRDWFALDDGHVLLHSLVGGGIDRRQMEVSAMREPAIAAAAATPAEAPLVAELRSFLRTKLAEYMVPPAIVVLDALPLTPNGKADRKALVSLGAAAAHAAAPYVAPRNELEGTLALVVQRVLHLEQVSVHQSFFELGASSLELVQVHRELCSVLQCELPVVEIFKYPTISALAEYLSQSTDDAAAVEQGQERAAARREALRQRRQRPVAEDTPDA